MNVLQNSAIAFLIALVCSGVAAYPVWKMLIKLKSRQEIYHLAPESHQKKQGTPTMGGIIILVGLVASVALAFGGMERVHDGPAMPPVDRSPLREFLPALWILCFAIVGFADDYIVPRMLKGKRGLGWKQKITAEVILAVVAGPIFGVPWEPIPVAITAFLVLFFSNAYNFADGLDALAASLGIVLCLGFSLLAAPTHANTYVLPLMGGLAGAFIPFLFLNAPPAKVFMGDVGSLPIGALFGVVAAAIPFSGWYFEGPAGTALAENWQPALVLPLILLSFVMIAELVPVPMQVGFYKLTKKRLFPMTPIHHAFEKKGWPESRVVWSFVVTQFALCMLAFGITLVGRPAVELSRANDLDMHVVGMARP